MVDVDWLTSPTNLRRKGENKVSAGALVTSDDYLYTLTYRHTTYCCLRSRLTRPQFFVRLVAATAFPREGINPSAHQCSFTWRQDTRRGTRNTVNKTQDKTHMRKKRDTTDPRQKTRRIPTHNTQSPTPNNTTHKQHTTQNTPHSPHTTPPRHTPSEREGGQFPLYPEILKQGPPPRKPPLPYPHKRLPPQKPLLAPLPRVGWARA